MLTKQKSRDFLAKSRYPAPVRRALTTAAREMRRHEEQLEQIPEVRPFIEENDPVRTQVAKLYGRGYPRRQIARALCHELCPNSVSRTEEQLISTASKKLRRWEMDQSFRDLVWENAVIELDMSTPQILLGVASKGKRGRVDAARLALEITGRHVPKGETPVTNVTIQLANISRPEAGRE